MRSSELEEAIEAIARDKRSGATELSIKAVDIFKTYVENSTVSKKQFFLDDLSKLGNLLGTAQPSMIPISNVVELVITQADLKAKTLSLQKLKNSLLDSLEDLKTKITHAQSRIAEHALNFIPDNAAIITLSESRTILEILQQAKAEDKLSKVIIAESRPLLEGLRMANKLLKLDVPVTFIVDAAMGFFAKEADLAIVGADTIQNDGSLVHKVGTYLLAMACYDQNKPFYVACDTLKFSKATNYADPVTIDQKPPSEIINPKELFGANIRNTYFDVTPAKYVTRIITDKGIFLPSQIAEYLLTNTKPKTETD
ncbi:translation initiation factor eIF-2B [Candidatus Bathyarchaeota archaeon]|nr:translation initiation factor eIF-2B [Candidatus Bathyarchaeota archaeon]